MTSLYMCDFVPWYLRLWHDMNDWTAICGCSLLDCLLARNCLRTVDLSPLAKHFVLELVDSSFASVLWTVALTLICLRILIVCFAVKTGVEGTKYWDYNDTCIAVISSLYSACISLHISTSCPVTIETKYIYWSHFSAVFTASLRSSSVHSVMWVYLLLSCLWMLCTKHSSTVL